MLSLHEVLYNGKRMIGFHERTYTYRQESSEVPTRSEPQSSLWRLAPARTPRRNQAPWRRAQGLTGAALRRPATVVEMMKQLVTTLGNYEQEQLGLILPHEHIFVALSAHEDDAWKRATAGEVMPMMVPELDRAKAAGVTALVECTPVGVGRRPDIVAAVSRAAALPVVVPTGVYREPFVPRWVHDASVEALREWMLIKSKKVPSTLTT